MTVQCSYGLLRKNEILQDEACNSQKSAVRKGTKTLDLQILSSQQQRISGPNYVLLVRFRQQEACICTIVFIRGAGQELFRWYTLPQDLTVFCCPWEQSEHYPCLYMRRRDEAARESAHKYTWLRAEGGNAATAHEEGPPLCGIAVEAGETRLLSPILPATLVQMGLFL